MPSAKKKEVSDICKWCSQPGIPKGHAATSTQWIIRDVHQSNLGLFGFVCCWATGWIRARFRLFCTSCRSVALHPADLRPAATLTMWTANEVPHDPISDRRWPAQLGHSWHPSGAQDIALSVFEPYRVPESSKFKVHKIVINIIMVACKAIVKSCLWQSQS